jgi:hypothetical protein
MSKVIFLDFDGVLNSRAFLLDTDRISRAASGPYDDGAHVDPVAVARLSNIVARTDARICISSTWRLLHPLGQLNAILKAKGFVGRVVGRTPEIREWGKTTFRDVEIRQWLNGRRDVRRWVVLDDEKGADLGDGSFVHTVDGLEDVHVERAVAWLSAEA